MKRLLSISKFSETKKPDGDTALSDLGISLSCEDYNTWTDGKEAKESYGKCRFVCIDPPFNVFHDKRHDLLDKDEYFRIVDKAKRFLTEDGALVIFCSFERGSYWYSAIARAQMRVVSGICFFYHVIN